MMTQPKRYVRHPHGEDVIIVTNTNEEEKLWRGLDNIWDTLRQKTGLDPEELERAWLLRRLAGK